MFYRNARSEADSAGSDNRFRHKPAMGSAILHEFPGQGNQNKHCTHSVFAGAKSEPRCEETFEFPAKVAIFGIFFFGKRVPAIQAEIAPCRFEGRLGFGSHFVIAGGALFMHDVPAIYL